MTHTPGPWSLDYDTIYFGDDVIENEIARAAHRGYTPADRAEKLANARLIAAAPDLLNALQNALDDNDGIDININWQEAARAAIAKATES